MHTDTHTHTHITHRHFILLFFLFLFVVLVNKDIYGSGVLDELDQAKRNVGDQNFFQRAILRASNRMRKKKNRERSENKKRNNSNCEGSSSLSEETKFRSIDRRKNPDLSVNINSDQVSSLNVSSLKALQIVRSQSLHNDRSNKPASPGEIPPPLPNKHASNMLAVSQNNMNKSDTQVEKIPKKPRSMTANDLSVIDDDPLVKASSYTEMNSRKLISNKRTDSCFNCKVDTNHIIDAAVVTDKAELNARQPRMSVDSLIGNHYKHPAKHAIDRTKNKRLSYKSKNDSQKTPTPPPRSPVSLGLEPSVFEFPSTENLPNQVDGTTGVDNKSIDSGEFSLHSEDSAGLLQEIDCEVKRRTVHSEDLSDDAFVTISSEPSPIPTNNIAFSKYRHNEPVYGNIQSMRIGSDSSNLITVNSEVVRRRNARRGSGKHLSDPLLIDAWSAATGEGQPASSLQDFAFNPTDYVNVKGAHSDDDNGSYVNVSSDDPMGLRKKSKPTPLRLRSYRNEFEKYDDDDSSIYHAVGAMDSDASHSSDCIRINQSDGSYENVNATRSSQSKHSDYLNLMSPAKSKNSKQPSGLNYIMVGGRGNYLTKSTSPVRHQPKSPIETYNKSDYTRIDENATGALNRSMLEHRRDKLVNKTPMKTSK